MKNQKNKKLKILIVTQYFWPENFRINDLANELKRKKHEISILTGQPNYPSGKIFPNYGMNTIGKSVYKGISIFRVPIIPRFSANKFQLVFNYLSYAFSASIFGALFLRKHNFDVIFVYEPSPITVGIPAILIKKIKKIPIVFWVQDLWPESILAVSATKSNMIIKFTERLVRWIYNHCDTILVQSKGFVEEIKLKGVSEDKIKYLPNWAEDFYKPLQVKKKSNLLTSFKNKNFKILFAGNLGEAQSLNTIIGAADLLRNEKITWFIIGDGRKKKWLQNEIKIRKLSKIIHLIGKKPAKKMPEYFSHADALLVTLSSNPIFSVTIPGKIQSYLACGKPIIAALDGEGARVINKSKSGVSVGSENYKKLAKAVLKFSSMSNIEIKKKGNLAKRFYDLNFKRDKLITKIENILKKQKGI